MCLALQICGIIFYRPYGWTAASIACVVDCIVSDDRKEGAIVVVVVLSLFILHSRESNLYCYILDGTSALAWELSFTRCLGRLSSSSR